MDHEGRKKAFNNLTDHGIDSEPTHVALIQYGMVWNPETGRYQFLIYAPDHVGPKHPPELAIPIIEDGIFVDLLFISDEMSFARATCRAHWLGRENLSCRWCGFMLTQWIGLRPVVPVFVISSRLAGRR